MSVNMTDEKKAEVRFSYAWDWWKFHASQRTQMFNFFIVVTGLLLNAYATALKGYIEYAIGIAVFGAIIALGFLLLDIRNRFQLEKADSNLVKIEAAELFPAAEGYKTQAGIDQPDQTAFGAQELVKHKFVLRGIEALAVVGWVALLFWTIQNPGRFVPPPAG